MVEDALSFWTEIQRYEDMLAADAKSYCFAPLSELYRKLGLLDDAVSVAQKGCALHPDYPVGFLALGNACYAKGMTAEARQALERVVSLKPDHLQALKLLGQLYVEQNDLALARKVLGQVLQQDPDDLESTMLLNSVASVAPGAPPEEELLEELEIIEDLEEVLDEPAAETAEPLDLTRRAPQPPPQDQEAHRPAAAPSEENEDFWAIEDLEEVEGAPAPPKTEAVSPRQAVPDPLTTATLAELYVSQGFLEKAMAIYRELVQAHPANQQYQLRCAELLEMQELQHKPTEPSSALQAPAVPEPPAKAQSPALGTPAAFEAPAGFEAPTGFEAPMDLEAPVAFEPPPPLEVPAAIEEETAFGLPGAMESPAEMESPALEPIETPDAPVGSEAGQGDVETELQRWLENIRRRRDGV